VVPLHARLFGIQCESLVTSPDGTRLAVDSAATQGSDMAVAVVTVAGKGIGAVQSLGGRFGNVTGWSPDGASVFVAGAVDSGLRGLYRYALRTHALSPIGTVAGKPVLELLRARPLTS
jgi:hypothetical protein